MFLGLVVPLLILSSLLNPQANIQASDRVMSPIPSHMPAPTNTPTPSPTPTLTPTPLPTATPTPTSAPTPTPTLVPQVLSSLDYEGLFDQYSSQYGVEKSMLKKIATCESGINPSSVNGPYGGMFQFLSLTWTNTRAEMGLDGNPDLRFSAKDAIETAAFKISHGGANAWAGCL